MLINVKVPTVVRILIFISMINKTSESLKHLRMMSSIARTIKGLGAKIISVTNYNLMTILLIFLRK